MDRRWIFPLTWMALIPINFIIHNDILTLVILVLGTFILAMTVLSVGTKFVPSLSLFVPDYIVNLKEDHLTFVIHLGVSIVTIVYSYMGIWSSVFGG